jgi:hypothetical protein
MQNSKTTKVQSEFLDSIDYFFDKLATALRFIMAPNAIVIIDSEFITYGPSHSDLETVIKRLEITLKEDHEHTDVNDIIKKLDQENIQRILSNLN